MQINGAHLTTAFIPKSFEFQDKVRAPVTIDAAARFDIEETSVTSLQPQRVTNINDSQQSRFVRLFASSNNNSNSEPTSELPSLPRGVQQYLQVANLNSDSEQLFDETV